MTLFPGKLLWSAAGAAALTLLTGCINTRLAIHYTPQPNIAPVAGASQVPIHVDVKDVRLTKSIGEITIYTEIGNFYYDCYATNDVATVVKQGIEAELANRGFKLSENGVRVLAGLNTFYTSDDQSGPTITLSVQVIKSDGTIFYSKLLAGRAAGWNVEPRLNKSLRKCITQLFADTSFIDGLLKASSEAGNNR